MPLELEALLGKGLLQRGLKLRADDFPRFRVEVEQEIALPRARMRLAEQAVVEPHLALVRVSCRDPMYIAFDLVGIGSRRARFAVGVVIAMHGGDPSRSVLVAACAFDHEAIAQPHLVSGI